MKNFKEVKKIIKEAIDYYKEISNCDTIDFEVLLQSENLNKKLQKIIGNNSISRENINFIQDRDTLKFIELYIKRNNIKIKESICLDSNPFYFIKMYLKEVNKFEVLSKEEEINYFKQYKDGDLNAYHMLINCNQRLVFDIVKKMSFDNDKKLLYIQEGNIGLMEAIKNFDLEHGCKFSTFATKYIKGAILNAERLSQGFFISPENKMLYNKMLDIEQEYKKEGLVIDDHKLASLLNIGVKRLQNLRLIPSQSVSLNEPIKDQSDSNEKIDFIKDSSIDIEDEVITKDKLKKVMNLLKENLSDFERKVIIIRYGFVDGVYKSQRKVAEMLNLKEYEVRKTEEKSLRKLRKVANKIQKE